MKDGKKILMTIAAALMLLLAGVTLFQPAEQMTDVYHLMAGLLTAGGITLLVSPAWREGEKHGGIVLCSFLSLLCLATLTCFSLPEAPVWQTGMEKSPVTFLIYIVLLVVLTGMAILVLLLTAFPGMRGDLTDDRSALKKARLRSMLVISAVSVAFLLSCYPGWNYPDIIMAWDQAFDEAWNEWHTLGFLYFVRLCSYLWGSPYMVLIVQTLLWLLVNAYVLGLMEDTGRVTAIRTYTMLSLLLFLPYIYLQAMMKDTIFSICMLGTCASLYTLVHREHLRTRDLITFALCSLGASLFRHAGVVVVCLAILIAILVRARLGLRELAWPISVLVAIPLVYFGLVNVLGLQVLEAKENPKYIKYTVPFYMAGEFVSDSSVEMDPEDIAFLETFEEISEWQAYHSKYYADPVAREYGMLWAIEFMEEEEFGPQIMALNVRCFLKYPLKYLENLSHITSILWQAARPADGYEWGPIEGMAVDYEQGISDVVVNGFTKITRGLSNLSGQLPIVRSVLWRGGLIQFAYFALICFLFARKRKRDIVMALPVVLFQASLYLSIPSQDPRYILGMIEVFPLFAVLGMIRTPKEQ